MSPRPGPSAPGRWAGLRAGLLALLCLSAAVDAVPWPPRGGLRRPEAQAELRRQAGALRALGLPVSDAALAEAVATGVEAGLRLRDALLLPTRPLRRWAGVGQAWALFSLPAEEAGRFVIYGRTRGGAWAPLFRAGEPSASPLSAALRHRRIRAVWDEAGDRPKASPAYDRLVAWAANAVFDVHDDIVEVELRVDRARLRPPGAPAPTASESPRQARRLRRPAPRP